MALPTSPANTWSRSLDLPSRLFGTDTEYELYEEEDAFVLHIEMPGFDRDDIGLSWDDGRLYVSAERVEEDRGRHRTFHRTFRFPKEIDADEIEAEYRNGVLEVVLPMLDPVTAHGEPIEVK